jgi:hypothetical protein
MPAREQKIAFKKINHSKMNTKLFHHSGFNTIMTAISIYIVLSACKKTNSGNQFSFPVVSYTLHTHFGNQMYDHAHTSIYVQPSSFSLNSDIYWDNIAVLTGTHGTYACEAHNMGSSYQVDVYEPKPQVYDSATGYYTDTRSILRFTLPSINSFTNRNDTSVLIYILDTSYTSHAIVSVTISSVNSNLYQEPTPTMTGSFDISGTVKNGSGLDSVSFSSTGTFTNMPYR